MISSVTHGATSAVAEAALAAAAAPLAAAAAKPKPKRPPPSPSRGQAVLSAAASALATPKKASASKSRKTSSSKATGYAKTTATKTGTTSKTSTASKTSSTTKATGELAFLDDPRISTEEKLFRFMMHVMDKYDRDLEQKMKEAGGKGTSASGGTSTSTTTTKKKSNPFSKIAGAIKTVIPAAGIALESLNNKNLQSLLKTISGPALAAGATALGMPALAPLLAKAGPQLAGVAFDLAKALDDPGTSTTTSTSKTSGGSTTGAGGDPEIDRKKVMELQYAMEKQKEMFSLVSNILRSMHDMKMVAVQNVRA